MDTSPVPNRAGMIVFNRVGQVLVISDLGYGTNKKWVFPKGHIEKGETTQQTAVREVEEEAGVVAVIDNEAEPIGLSKWTQKNENVVVEWWTGLALNRLENLAYYDEPSWRDIAWMSPKEALEMLSFPTLRNALRRAICQTDFELE